MKTKKMTPSEMKKIAEAFSIHGAGGGWGPDVLYACAMAALNGEIEISAQCLEDLLDTSLYLGFLYCDSAETALERYPAAVYHLPDMIAKKLLDHISPAKSFDLGNYYEAHGNAEMAFQCYLGGAVSLYTPKSEMAYINCLLFHDACNLELARCYTEGIGTERNYPLAFECYWNYHKNLICYEYGSDQLSEDVLSDLFLRMKAESDAGINYPGLHYALALMANEGFGTAYNRSLYLQYYKKEMENYPDDVEPEWEYPIILKEYHHTTLMKPIYRRVKEADATDIWLGDVVRLGKYNHRDILWHVIEKKDGRALLLSTACLESGYMLNRKYDQIVGYSGSPIHAFLHFNTYNFFNNVENELPEFDTTERIEKNEDGDSLFLLSVDDIERCDFEESVALGFAREQAGDYSHDGRGMEINEETGASPWWTCTQAKDSDNLVYVTGDAEWGEESTDCEFIGVRPAMWLKLK